MADKIKELLNCPICHRRPFAPTKYKKRSWMTSCANRDCEIFQINIPLDKWNERVSNI